MVDYGDRQLKPDDDYPDFIVPLAGAVARGEVDRGAAICGSGVGACIAANKVPGTRACLIHESFSAHQGVEDDDMNVICLGGRVIANTFAWELVKVFLEAQLRTTQAANSAQRVAVTTLLSLKDECALALQRGSIAVVDSQAAVDPLLRLPALRRLRRWLIWPLIAWMG